MQSRVARYVEALIWAASAVAAESIDKLKPPIHTVLWWVLATIIPGSGANIASKKNLDGWRASILPLLQNVESSELTRGDSGLGAAHASPTLRNAGPATSAATVDRFAPECCFKCTARGSVTSVLLRCCHVERDEGVAVFVADGSRCQIGVCVKCVGLKSGKDVKPDPWYCRIHVSKGKDSNQQNVSIKCWECPASECPASKRPASKRPRGRSGSGTKQPSELAQRVNCGFQLCFIHALRTPNETTAFVCWVCQGRGPFTAMVRMRLLRLLHSFTRFARFRDLSEFTEKR